MGNYHKKKELKHKKEIMENKCINYHCKLCKEIPLINFSEYDFDFICSSHKILNINIDEFYNYIIFDYECSICKVSSNNSNNYFYCYKCNKIYCENCIINHKQDINNFHTLINMFQKNSICLLHNKRYIKYCLKCKLNLCELCENHNNHYIKLFRDIYPLKEEIDKFNKIISELLNNKNKEKDYIQESNKLKEFIKIKTLLVKSFTQYISNYNYINNMNNIIRTTSNIDKYYKKENNILYIDNIDLKKDINNIVNKKLIKSLSNTDYKISKVWYIKQLNIIKINPQQNLELIAIGGDNNIILILNIITFRVYQIIKEHNATIYSFAQYKDNPNFYFFLQKMNQ